MTETYASQVPSYRLTREGAKTKRYKSLFLSPNDGRKRVPVPARHVIRRIKKKGKRRCLANVLRRLEEECKVWKRCWSRLARFSDTKMLTYCWYSSYRSSSHNIAYRQLSASLVWRCVSTFIVLVKPLRTKLLKIGQTAMKQWSVSSIRLTAFQQGLI